jgi:hypothetical protein
VGALVGKGAGRERTDEYVAVEGPPGSIEDQQE